MFKKERPSVLIVDDEPNNIRILSDLLRDDYQVLFAKSGAKALELAQNKLPHLIILDIMMPDMDGYEVCQKLKSNPVTHNIPVMFATAMSQDEDEERGLKLGAVDYVTKPFRLAIVKARVNNHLELVEKRKQTEDLLLNILPRNIIDELKQQGCVQPKLYENVSILFTDLAGFTAKAKGLEPAELLHEINEIFTTYDNICAEYNCERIKTIGDCYMAVCGLPQKNPAHATHLVSAARDFHRWLEQRTHSSKHPWQARTGVHSGRCIGAIVGITKYIYDIFGDDVNVACRVESSAEIGSIFVTQATKKLINPGFKCISKGMVALKGRGEMELFKVE